MLKTFTNDNDKLYFINTNNNFICSKFNKSNVFNDHGLKNLGNTCYIAAILKALSCSNEVIDFLIKTYNDYEFLFSNFKEYKLFESYIKLLNNKDASIQIKWQNFYNSLSESELRDFIECPRQQDAHEFLLKFLCYLDECILEAQLVKRGVSENEEFAKVIDQMRQFSFLERFFQLKSKIIRNQQTQLPESEVVLMLDILDNDSNSIDLISCIRDSFNYKAEIEMKEEVAFEKRILKLNKLLIIQLKLFKVRNIKI